MNILQISTELTRCFFKLQLFQKLYLSSEKVITFYCYIALMLIDLNHFNKQIFFITQINRDTKIQISSLQITEQITNQIVESS